MLQDESFRRIHYPTMAPPCLNATKIRAFEAFKTSFDYVIQQDMLKLLLTVKRLGGWLLPTPQVHGSNPLRCHLHWSYPEFEPAASLVQRHGLWKRSELKSTKLVWHRSESKFEYSGWLEF